MISETPKLVLVSRTYAEQMYNSFVNPYMNTYPNTVNNSGCNLLKVTGFEGAKMYPLGANQTAVLFDANDNKFWLKTTDSAGFALYKAFTFNEVVVGEKQNLDSALEPIQRKSDEPCVTGEAISRREFDELKSEVTRLCKMVLHPNDEVN